jgi:alpha-galactosidase
MATVTYGKQRSAIYFTQPEALGEEQKREIRNSFATASRKQPLGEPLDWMCNPKPEEWILNGSKIHFDWT